MGVRLRVSAVDPRQDQHGTALISNGLGLRLGNGEQGLKSGRTMEKIVECVPNFSEGRNKAVIEAIADEIRQTEGVMLLDVDPGAATNRTVVTFVGEPDAVVEAAFRAIKKAAELIDMRKHQGEHPRIGATDVCPFVPVSGVTMQDCVELAHRLGKRVGEELGASSYQVILPPKAGIPFKSAITSP